MWWSGEAHGSGGVVRQWRGAAIVREVLSRSGTDGVSFASLTSHGNGGSRTTPTQW
jgi:hypothetical protein